MVGDQHQPVFLPIFAHLRAAGGQPAIFRHALDLDHAAFRQLARQRPARALGELAGDEQTGVRAAGSGIFQLRHRQHARFQRLPDRVQQVDQRRVVGSFLDPATGGANLGQGGEVGFSGRLHGVSRVGEIKQ